MAGCAASHKAMELTTLSLPTMHEPGRRQATRAEVMGRFVVSVEFSANLSGLLVDVSETGIGVQSLTPLKPHTMRQLSFRLPQQDKRIEAKGRVVWANRAGSAGIMFTQISDQARDQIVEWIQQNGSGRDHPATLAPAAVSVGELGQNLSDITERARDLTKADGAALALLDETGMVCRASVGHAPDVGVAVGEKGLTAQCIRTGDVVRCDDAFADLRVDQEIREELGIRSVIVVPIFSRKGVAGVLVALSKRANVFDSGDVLSLRALADAVGTRLAQGEPVEEPDWMRDAAQRQAKGRNRILFVLLGVIAVLLIALIVVNIVERQQERPLPPAPTATQPAPRT